MSKKALMFGGQAAGVAAAAFIARTSGLTQRYKAAYIGLINGLVADGVWAKLDCLWIPATKDSTTARLNLVSTSFTLTDIGTAPTFTADRGFSYTNNTGTKCIDTAFNTSTGTTYLQNSAHVSLWNPTSSTATDTSSSVGNKAGIGAAVIQLYPKFSDNNCYLRVGDDVGTLSPGFANTQRQGFFVANRSSSTARQGYINGASAVSFGSFASAAPNNDTLVLLGANLPATTNTHDTVAAASAGGDVSSVQNAFYTRLRTYMTALGVP